MLLTATGLARFYVRGVESDARAGERDSSESIARSTGARAL